MQATHNFRPRYPRLSSNHGDRLAHSVAQLQTALASSAAPAVHSPESSRILDRRTPPAIAIQLCHSPLRTKRFLPSTQRRQQGFPRRGITTRRYFSGNRNFAAIPVDAVDYIDSALTPTEVTRRWDTLAELFRSGHALTDD